MIWRTLAICSLAAAGLVAVTAVRADDPTATLVPSDWQPLHDRWQAAMKALNIPGLAVVAVKGDEVVLLDALGVCDPAGKQHVTPRSPFYLASVTKSFTALGVAILVDEGKVKLDEPVQTYLPRFTLADADAAAKITVRDLLAHRPGISSSPITLSEAYFGNITEDRYYRALALVESPGHYEYTNLHYTLAGRIIQAVTGKSWKDFLAERVFAPLAMRDATCYASRLYANPLAAWPIVDRNGAWQLAPLVKNDAVMHAAGGMGASATDLGNWLRFHITGKTPKGQNLISPELLREMHTQQATDPEPGDGPPGLVSEGYSLGWFTGKYAGRPILWHGGGYVGTATHVSFFPEEGVGVAVLINQSAPNSGFPLVVAADVYGKLLELETPDLLPEMRAESAQIRERIEKRKELEWTPPGTAGGLSQAVEKYAGTFENPIWGEMTVTLDDGRLALGVGDHAMRCHSLGEDSLRIEILPGDATTGKFQVGEDGTVDAVIVVTPMGRVEFRRIAAP